MIFPLDEIYLEDNT